MYSIDEATQASLEYFNGDELATNVFLTKYALRDKDGNLLEKTPNEMHRRIAKELARIEKNKFKEPLTEDEIFEYLLKDFKKIIPQGSCMYGIGNKYQYVTLSNCYVVPSPHDSYLGINYTDTQITQISSRRGGVGWSMSNLRPKFTRVSNAAGSTSGVISFMGRYSNTIREVCQCIIEGSKVLTKQGIKNIEYVSINDYVWTKTGWVKVINKLSHRNKKDLYEITTKSGYKIGLSGDHVVNIQNNGVIEERKVKDLFLNDEIILIPGAQYTNKNIELKKYVYPKKTFTNKSNRLNDQVNLPTTLTEDLAYFLGYSYGDGYVEYDQFDEPMCLTLSCSNDYNSIKETIHTISKLEFNYDISYRDGCGDLERLSINNKSILYHLWHNGLLKQKSSDQIFPEKILNAPSNIQMAFISGYFDADGYASGSKKGYVFTSVNKKFIESIQLILMSNGIVSKLYMENRENLGWQNLYTLCIVGTTAQQLTLKLLKNSIKISNKNFVSKKDCWTTPYKAKVNNIKYGNYNYINNVDFISASAYMRLQQDGEQLYNLLLKDKIVNIVEIPPQNTYDLQLESEYNFWCNGFYVHNSGRRGASLQSLNVAHPEILDFIKCKNDDVSITGSNISIEFTDEFMDAVINNKEFELKWPLNTEVPSISTVVSAIDIWNQFIENTWQRAEPGAIFIDTVHRRSTSAVYPGFEEVAPNPCGEQYLPPYGCCRLIAQNLYTYVQNKFSDKSYFDFDTFINDVKIMQRLADDIVDLDIEAVERIIAKIESDPEPDHIKQIGLDLWKNVRDNSIKDRRTGCGIVGLADTLAALGLKYDSSEALEFCDKLFKEFKLAAYDSSVEMAKELGSFPVYNYELDKQSEFIQQIKDEDINLYNRMKKYGRRNMTLLTIAPTGSVAIVSQVSSGLEPVFQLTYTRRKKINPSEKDVKPDFIDKSGDLWKEYTVFHKAYQHWMMLSDETQIEKSPYYNACSHEIDFEKKVELQAVIQKHIDNSISVTTNLPADIDKETVSKLYLKAYKLGCKGFTIYRDGCRSGVLVSKSEQSEKLPDERPRELPCDVHHITVKGQQYFVLVGLMDGRPYEVFAGKNGYLTKRVKNGIIIRKRKDFYKAEFPGFEEELSPITASTDEMEECVTRLTSGLLRVGADMHFIVKQLEKVGERQAELHSFARSVVRALKKYIPDGTKEDGICTECGAESLVRQEGCLLCQSCGYSKCL